MCRDVNYFNVRSGIVKDKNMEDVILNAALEVVNKNTISFPEKFPVIFDPGAVWRHRHQSAAFKMRISKNPVEKRRKLFGQ